MSRRLQDWIVAPGSDFAPGDKVEYCGEQAVVIANHGRSGVVEIPGEGRMTWYWDFAGEQVRRVQ